MSAIKFEKNLMYNKIEQCTSKDNTVEKPYRSQLLKQKSFTCEVDLGAKLHCITNSKYSGYGGDSMMEYVISNILSCVLLNKLTIFTHYIIHSLNTLDLDLKLIIIPQETFGILLLIKISGDDFHSCSFSTCNNNKVFINNHNIYQYDWPTLINKYNDLINEGTECRIVYGSTTRNVPAILIIRSIQSNDTDDNLYYYNNINNRFMYKKMMTLNY